MPRRNRNPRRKTNTQRAQVPQAEPTTYELAERLVRAGKCSPLILMDRPKRALLHEPTPRLAVTR